jgi:serine phosphatase RsbU (regulator of sigma subunit)/anti-anti-sigma regulatory factor
MQAAALPKNEQHRVDALRAYAVLDTLPEKAYDDIVFIASTICDMPIATVSLVDTDRQWFKARRGIDAEQTPRAISFCAHAILEPANLLIVEDALLDARFANNPLVRQQPKIRFYAGAPLVTSEGDALGTLCVIDTRPRRLDAEQQEMLRGLSRQVIAQLELRRTVAELERRNTQLRRSHDELAKLCQLLEGQRDLIERDLHRAEIIQRSLLPQQVPDLNNCYLQTLYRPGHVIGGDFYDLVSLNGGKLALVVADASGHGVSAAMLSVLFKHYLNFGDKARHDPGRPGTMLSRVNASLHAERLAAGVFITAVYCLVDVDKPALTIASAGHLPVICLRSNGSFDTIEHTGPALGLEAAATYEEVQVSLQQGDRVLIYTDGLQALNDDAPPTASEIASELHAIGLDEAALDKLLTQVASDRERSDRDDITLVLLNVAPGENRLDDTGEGVHSTVVADDTANEISYADTDEHGYFFFAGRLTWTYGQSLFDQAVSVIDTGRGLILDFADCALLDSTLLGTLHELVMRANTAAVGIRLQQLSPTLIAAFEELSMQQVLDSVATKPVPVPAKRHKLDLIEVSPHQQQERLLKAHELLAELSDQSQAEFSSLIEILRSEIRAKT